MPAADISLLQWVGPNGGWIVLWGTDNDASIDRALRQRRSVRRYRDELIPAFDLGKLLWAAQGVTDAGGQRTTPSAGGLYPLELLAVVGKVDGLQAGIYRDDSWSHTLSRTAAGDRRAELGVAALDQDGIADAAAVIVLAAVYARTTAKYGERGIRYVHMEVGAAAQNVYLQAAALDLGTVFIGAFDDGAVSMLLELEADEYPLCLLPVGRPASGSSDI